MSEMMEYGYKAVNRLAMATNKYVLYVHWGKKGDYYDTANELMPTMKRFQPHELETEGHGTIVCASDAEKEKLESEIISSYKSLPHRQDWPIEFIMIKPNGEMTWRIAVY